MSIKLSRENISSFHGDVGAFKDGEFEKSRPALGELTVFGKIK